MQKTLLVIITDRLSQLVEKGELIDRYYNPGGIFNDVHIIMTNDDRPDIRTLQRMVGEASLTIHNIPAGKGLLARTFWRPSLLHNWAEPCITLAKDIKPQMIRCYGNFLNGYVGARIRQKLGIPLFVSLHTQPDETRSNPDVDFKTKLFYLLSKRVENYTLANADKVSCVYGSIMEYAVKHGANAPFVAYNVINPGNIVRKEDYRQSGPLRILYVGRVIPAKSPENIIKALQGLSAELTVVGSGSMVPELKKLTSSLGLEGQVQFISSMPNDELCRTMHSYDLFAGHSQYSEIPKTVLESTLCGLPVLFNRRRGNPVPEFEKGIVRLVEDSPEGYREGIKFFEDENNRSTYGLKAFHFADSNWNPQYAESVFAGIHRELISK